MARGINTKCLHLEEEEGCCNNYGSISFPIYQTATYEHPAVGQSTGFDYSRLQNPTREHLEKMVAALENGIDAFALSSGMAAISLLMELFRPGDHIIADSDLYGGSIRLFHHVNEKNGVEFSGIDCCRDDVESYVKENTKAIYIETPTNPMMNVTDIRKMADIAKRHNLILIVDNTFATPYLFRPLEHGADVVVESATKFIGGHGTTLGGVIVEGGNFNWAEVPGKFPTLTEPDPSYHGLNFYEALGGSAFVTRIRAILLRDTGATLSPFSAFLLLQGTETLSLRVERHVENALKVIDYLKTVPEVESISHPSIEGRKDNELYKKYFPNGGGSIFTFDIKGGKDAARVFIDNLHLFSLLANVADAKSLVIHPASTTHSQETPEELEDQGIHQGTIRLSIGTENIEDILDDLKGGFAALRESGLAK